MRQQITRSCNNERVLNFIILCSTLSNCYFKNSKLKKNLKWQCFKTIRNARKMSRELSSVG
jgi:hypothetical protein